MKKCLFTTHHSTRFYCDGVEITYAEFYELLPGYDYDAENAVYWKRETVQGDPKTHGARKVVHVCHIDGTTETDAEWWGRQGELADLAATMDAASYRGQ